MRPTFLAFQTAYRAISTNQLLLDTTGHNISNVDTTGYTRQRVDVNSVSNGGYIQRYKPQQLMAGQGVEASRISQLRDSFLDARYRMQNAEDNKFVSILNGLGDLEKVLDQTMSNGILSEIAAFKNALNPMLGNPASSDMAMVVRSAAEKVTSLLNMYSQLVDNAREQQIFDTNVYVNTDFNAIVRNIAALDKQINEEMAHGSQPNELLDQRNLLFDKLSGLANVNITITPKKLSASLSVERVQISIVDSKTGKHIDLVDDEDFNTLTAFKRPDGTLGIEVNSSFGNEDIKDITQYMTGGAIGGALDVINGKGDFGTNSNNDNLFRGTLYYQGMLDTFAANFARVFNDINRYNPNNVQPTDPSLSPLPSGERRDLFGTIDGTSIITAANIKISDAWAKDPMHLTIDQPDDLSAGENIGRMIVAITNGFEFFIEGNTEKHSLFSGTLEEFLTGVNATLGLDVSLYTNYSETSQYVMTSLFQARESVSGVNLEEEGVYLMTYQKSYNAAVRYFTVLDETVNKIINEMGLAGR